jgi:L-threonylcarbamoyladenylate synthase
VTHLERWAQDVPELALELAQAFWPGPLTLVLKKHPSVNDLITGGQDTIALRVPNHPMATALLSAFGSGLAAPSANRFGRISPTTAQAVATELGRDVDMILDGGQCDVGLESTIVDLSSAEPVLLRPGMIAINQIEKITQRTVLLSAKNMPRVSGSMESHYAPQTKCILVETNQLKTLLVQLEKEKFTTALMAYSSIEIIPSSVTLFQMSSDVNHYAHDLYQTLRTCDEGNFHLIVIEKPPQDKAWQAIADRLQRATA